MRAQLALAEKRASVGAEHLPLTLTLPLSFTTLTFTPTLTLALTLALTPTLPQTLSRWAPSTVS